MMPDTKGKDETKAPSSSETSDRSEVPPTKEVPKAGESGASRPQAMDQMETGFSGGRPKPGSPAESPTILTDRFRYEAFLGGGGQGVVWRAFDKQEEREVAVKLIMPKLRGEERWLKLARREMQILHALRHPNVIQTYAIFPEEGAFSMELLRGETLQTRLQRGGRLSLLSAIEILQETLFGLEALHTAGLIHRDLKPANIFLKEHVPPRVILLDLGIAHEAGRSLLSLTAGTPYYMAPEIVQGAPSITPKADLYSLGVILYALVTGEIPILGSPDLADLYHEAILQKPLDEESLPTRKEAIFACVKEDLAPLYRALIHRDPAQRPSLPTLRETLDALSRRLTPLFEPPKARTSAMPTALRLELLPAYSALAPGQTLSIPLLLRLQALEEKEMDIKARSPVALSLCIDNSGSMQGKPIELVLDSIRLVSEHLKDTDQIALISFSDNAKTWLSLQTHGKEAKALVKKALEEIKSDASTAMYAGLEAALDDLQRSESLLPRRVLLLTDGHPNSGPSSPEALARLTRQKRGTAVVSTFGYGESHKESILQEIAAAGGGGYTFVESEGMAPAAFALELGALFSTVARNARLILKPHEGCKVVRVRGNLEQAFSSEGLEVKLTDFIAGQKAELLADLEIEALPSHKEGQPWATIRLSFWPPEAPEAVVVEKELHLSIVAGAAQDAHPEVSRFLLLLDTANLWKEAKAFADRREFLKAAEHLQPILPRLQADPTWVEESSPVRDWYEQIVDEIELYKSRPDAQRYQGFRKQSVSEMAVPGEMTYAGKFTNVGYGKQNMAQMDMMDSFRLDSRTEARLERLDAQGNVVDSHPIGGQLSIGRSPVNEIQIASGKVSKRHANVSPDKFGFVVVDLRTSNGTFVNGQPVNAPTHLKNGDQILVGDVTFRFVLPEEDADAEE